MNLQITLKDFNTEFPYAIKEADMFVSGTEIEGDEGAQTCYLAVFRSQVKSNETWFVGNVFMRE